MSQPFMGPGPGVPYGGPQQQQNPYGAPPQQQMVPPPAGPIKGPNAAGPMTNGHYAGPAPPSSGPVPGGMPNTNQLTNNMANMSLNGQGPPQGGFAPPMPGAPTSQGQPYMPPAMGNRPQGPGALPHNAGPPMPGQQPPGIPNQQLPGSMPGQTNSMPMQPPSSHNSGSFSGPPSSGMNIMPAQVPGTQNMPPAPQNLARGHPSSNMPLAGPSGIPNISGPINNSMAAPSMPPAPVGAPVPPASMGGSAPPHSGNVPPPMGGSMPPLSMGGAMPPAMGGNMPISTMGASMPPMGAPPSSMGGPMPPSSMGGPMPPSSMGGPMPPTSMGGPMPPSSMGGSMPPASMGGPMPPASMGGPMPPSSMGGPMPNMGGPMPPPGQFQGQPGSYQQGGGFPQQPGTYPPPGGTFPGQQQQPRRLNPDQMPSHIQVIEDDRTNKGGLFQTGPRGLVPPLVTTDFYVEDGGNASPRMMRSSLYAVPCTADLLKASNVPFALSITPFAKLQQQERPPQCIDLGALGPVRCNRCKAYMCPSMQFIDGGRRFQCCFCSCATEVPPEYFAHLDHTGRRTDAYERPEFSAGTYEMVATTDYCRDNKLPNMPAFIFMIDVSYNSIKSGLVNLMCSRMKEVLQSLPRDYGAEESSIRIGFVTYDKEIHFYNVKGNLSQPQMLVVSDIQDVFVPLLDGFLVKYSESEAVIDSLMEQIPVMFANNQQTEVVLGPVVQAGVDAMKAADCAGKLLIFHSSLPNAQAPGQLKNRDDRKVLGTDKEKTLLSPSSNFYTKLGEECVKAGCGVDIFLFPNTYTDIASIAEVTRLSGGQIYKYTYFQGDLDGGRFIDDLKENLERNIAFDVTMRVRTSTGIRPVDFFGNFYMSNTTDIELAVLDSNKCVTVEIKHDDKLAEEEGAYIQAAVLYTSVSGQRRLRIINLALNCTTQMAEMYRNCELDVIINHMAKKAIRETLNSNPKTMRDNIMSQCVNILACYRKNCSNQSSEGQLILPEAMKLLPVYSNCIIKSTALQGTEIHTDDRSWLMNLVNAMSVVDSNVFFYPTLMPLHDVDPDSALLPKAIRCSYERLSDQGVYLLENGLAMYLWLGINVSPDWVQKVFGVASAAQIDIDKTQLHDLDNPLSRRVKNIIRTICRTRNRHMKLIIVRQRDKLEPMFQQYLVEDRGSNGSASYVDYLCHIHKEIRTQLS